MKALNLFKAIRHNKETNMTFVVSRAILNGAWAGKTCKSLLLGSMIALALGTVTPWGSVALADSDRDGKDCDTVGGAFVTNFIAPDQTAGVATGDLKGSLGVKIVGTVSGTVGNGKPVTLKVQHFWVTETGDTLVLAEADVTGYPGTSPSQPLLYSFVYEKGIKLIGGTGRFEDASGQISAWGSLDLGAGEVVGRYSGKVCFKDSRKD